MNDIVSDQSVVGLTWQLEDTLGEVLDTLDDPVEFLIGGNDLFAKIQDALKSHTLGEVVQLQLEPEEAFGDYNEQLLFIQQRALLPQGLEEGMVLEGHAIAQAPEHMPANVLYTVSSIYPEHVVLDGNHPLAGIALRLTMKIESIRSASEEELRSGSTGVGFFSWDVDLPPPAADRH